MRRMSSWEFTYWEAREKLEPGEPDRSDLRAAQICYWVYKMNKGKRAPNLKLSDFVLLFKQAPVDEGDHQTGLHNKVRMQMVLGV